MTGVYVRALIILLHAGVGGQCGHYEPPYSYWCAETTQGGGAAQYVVPSGALLWHRCMTRYSITSTINERSDLHSNTMLSSPSRTCRAHSPRIRTHTTYCIMHNAVIYTRSGCMQDCRLTRRFCLTPRTRIQRVLSSPPGIADQNQTTHRNETQRSYLWIERVERSFKSLFECSVCPEQSQQH